MTMTDLQKVSPEEFETRFVFKLSLIGENYVLPISELNFYANPFNNYEKSWEKISAMNKVITTLRAYLKTNSMDLMEQQLFSSEPIALLDTKNANFLIELVDLQNGSAKESKVVYSQQITASEFAVQNNFNIIPIWKDKKNGIRNVLKTFLGLRSFTPLTKNVTNAYNNHSLYKQDLQTFA